jgi:hypothetical protein
VQGAARARRRFIGVQRRVSRARTPRGQAAAPLAGSASGRRPGSDGLLAGRRLGWGVRVGPVLRFGPRQAAGVEGGTTDLRSR